MVQNAGEKTEVLASLEQTYDSELNDGFIVTFEPEWGVKVGETGWGQRASFSWPCGVCLTLIRSIKRSQPIRLHVCALFSLVRPRGIFPSEIA